MEVGAREGDSVGVGKENSVLLMLVMGNMVGVAGLTAMGWAAAVLVQPTRINPTRINRTDDFM
jgi:hypothetical protein